MTFVLVGGGPTGVEMAGAIAELAKLSILKDFKNISPEEVSATVGRTYAIANIAGYAISGYFAWLIWAIVHILYLIGFRNRLFVTLDWFYSYFTFQKSSRLIVEKRSNNILI